MKESYEERVRELEAEVTQLTDDNSRAMTKARDANAALQRQVREAREAMEVKVEQVRSESAGDSKQQLHTEVPSTIC